MNCDKNSNFLKNKRLENQFLGLFFNDLNAEVMIQKKKDSILITNDKTKNIYEFYNIQLNLLNDANAFLHDFTKLVNNFKKKGFLILNFKMNYNEGVVFTPYFVNIINLFEKSTDFSKEINNFFNLNLLKKQCINLKSLASLLWRNQVSNDYFSLTKFNALFSTSSQYDFTNLSSFNSQLEQHLLKKRIAFKRLNQNLLFINQHSLFITIFEFDPQALLKLLKKFHSKYFIFLLILNDEVYEEVLKIDKIDFLSNIKVINSEKFLKLDFNDFKEIKMLENPQINSNILS